MAEPEYHGDSLSATDLTAVTAEARAANAAHAKADKARREREHEKKVEAFAQDFLRLRTEHLADILRGEARKGRSEVQVWTFNQPPHGEEVRTDGTLRGMRYVGAWLHERGFIVDLRDHGAENVPDWGFEHKHSLTVRWPSCNDGYKETPDD